MSGRDDVWQTIEQFTDTFRRRDDHTNGVLSSRATTVTSGRGARPVPALEGERRADRYG